MDNGEVIPNDRDAEDESVDAVEHAAVSWKKDAGVFYASRTLTSGLEEIAQLASDVAKSGDGEKMKKGDVNPTSHYPRDDKGAQHATDGTFPRFLGTELRGKGMPANGAANKVGYGVRGPRNDESEKKKVASLERDAMQTHSKRKRKSDE